MQVVPVHKRTEARHRLKPCYGVVTKFQEGGGCFFWLLFEDPVAGVFRTSMWRCGDEFHLLAEESGRCFFQAFSPPRPGRHGEFGLKRAREILAAYRRNEVRPTARIVPGERSGGICDTIRLQGWNGFWSARIVPEVFILMRSIP